MQTRVELFNLIKADRNRYNYTFLGYLRGMLLNSEYSHALKLLKSYRKCRYLKLNKEINILYKIFYVIQFVLYKRLQYKYDTYITLDSEIGGGLWFPHMGGIIINCISMGNNCSVSKGVVIGNKAGQENRPTIGDNCYFTLGAKVIGKVCIGDNVIVAQNSVVIKDVPNNTIVSGVPAKTIKTFNNINEINI